MRNLILKKDQKKAISFVVLNICAIASYFFLAFVSKKAFAWESPAITLWPASGLANALANPDAGQSVIAGDSQANAFLETNARKKYDAIAQIFRTTKDIAFF